MKFSQLLKPSSRDNSALRQTISALVATRVVPRAAAALDGNRQSTGSALLKAIMDEVAAFSGTANPDIVPSLNAHIGEHLDELRRLFAGGDVGTFEFLETHARRRAEQKFPLEASLHAYRCAHKILAVWLRDAAIQSGPPSVETAVSAVADFAIEYTNTVSNIIAAEYIAHTRTIANAESDRRSELFNILLGGLDESDSRAHRLLKRAGYLEQRQSYCVVAAQSANPAEMDLPDRAERISNALSAAVSGRSIRILSGIRNNVVVAILSDARRQSGWTAPQKRLADRLEPLLLTLGPAVIVGTSNDHPSTAFLPKAMQESSIALDFASVSRRVVQFSSLPIRNLIIHRGGDLVRSTAPYWIALLVDADAKVKGSLLKTLRALADADLNVQKAGRQLAVHPNTVYTRIERVKDLTGLDGHRYHDLVELLLAMDCWEV